MRTRVKFCGLVESADVDCAVRLGVDAVGFVLWPRSPRVLTVEQAAALRRQLPSWVLAVGLVVNASPPEVADAVSGIGLDVVQFHGDETPQECGLSPIPWWRAVRMRSATDLAHAIEQYPQAEALVLDAFSDAYGGSGHSFDWNWVVAGVGASAGASAGVGADGAMSAGQPVAKGCSPARILSGGLHSGNVRDAIVKVRPDWVDVSSGIQVEGAPRLKSESRMQDFMSQVLTADSGADCAVPLGSRQIAASDD
jgi:phosphoribosylanthranilate isomerase